jgi:hypothetical protein
MCSAIWQHILDDKKERIIMSNVDIYEVAKESLDKLIVDVEKMDPQEELRQDSVNAVFTAAELLEAIQNIKYVSNIEFSSVYSEDEDEDGEDAEDFVEMTGLDDFLIQFEMHEEVNEGPIEYIAGWIEYDVTYEVLRDHNEQQD